MKVSIDKYPIVKVTWVDATDGDTGWVSFDDIISHKLSIVVDIGWLVVKTKEKIILMSSFGDDPDSPEGGRYTAIPSSWIKKVEYLKVESVKVIE
jgi:hypothetical protein